MILFISTFTPILYELQTATKIENCTNCKIEVVLYNEVLWDYKTSKRL